ncbi:MAG TPA: FdhF/YdeP family oxidoreductase, partial [Gemmatimonadaceae bacterium]|nr:FdhF/YdeP family oxidoreductase [Gemmatimonadaceae bacterium]
MTDTAAVDPLTRLAEGYFPTHAARPASMVQTTPAVREAVGRACEATADGHDLAVRAQPPIEKIDVAIRHPSHSAAGLPAIAESFKIALEKLGYRDTMRVFATVNQKTGFDCQSCAWPSPDGKRHKFEFCENGAKAMANEGARHTIGRAFFRKWSIDALAAQSDYWLNAQGRLIEPLYRREGAAHYEPITWDETFALLGRTLRGLDSPHRAAFYTSGRASNEVAFLYGTFARQFGTNNLPDCSNMCHESSGTALVESLGIGKGSVTLEDFEQTDLIVLIGQNPATNHPRMLTSLEHAKKHGATIIVINPLREPGLFRFTDPNPDEYANPVSFAAHVVGPGRPLGDLHLPVRINGDIALLKGLMKTMLAEEARTGKVLDHDFIRDQTDGFEALVDDLQATSWRAIVDGCGVSREDIEHAGRMIARAKRMICCWAMGLTQHKDAVAGIQMLVNMLLLGGHIGRPGAGTCCVRGHSNVQGDRTMGIWERPSKPFLDALSHEFGFEPPRQAGHDTVDTIAAMHNGEIEVFFGLGGNFLSATPDTACTADALRRCRLTAHVATNLNRAHLITGREALLLPCLGRSERDAAGFVTVEDSFGIISSSQGPLEPASPDLRSEIAIVAGMAKATLGENTTVDWDGLAADYNRIRDHISRVVPGTNDFNARIAQGPFYLPNSARERRFVTSTGKAHFTVAPISKHDLEAEEFLLTTVRSHDQFNTTVYGLHDRYRGVYGARRVLFINRDDAAERGWTAGQRVDITSHFGDERRVARAFQLVPFSIPRRCVAAYFPEANVLVP